MKTEGSRSNSVQYLILWGYRSYELTYGNYNDTTSLRDRPMTAMSREPTSLRTLGIAGTVMVPAVR